MSKLQIPVTVTNVACELFNRVYKQAAAAKYLIDSSWCKPQDLHGLSLYLYLDSFTCNPDIDEKCLVGKLYANNVPCDRTANTYTCNPIVTQISTTSCEVIQITIL